MMLITFVILRHYSLIWLEILNLLSNIITTYTTTTTNTTNTYTNSHNYENLQKLSKKGTDCKQLVSYPRPITSTYFYEIGASSLLLLPPSSSSSPSLWCLNKD